MKLVEAAVASSAPRFPSLLHLDHGPDFETCKSCIDGGFTSVMIDASSMPFAENIADHQEGRRVRPRPRRRGGGRAGHPGRHRGRGEGRGPRRLLHPARGGRGVRLPRPAATPWPSPSARQPRRLQVHRRLSAPATSRASWCRLRCASTCWRRSPSRLPGFPIVLHGSSSVPQEYVKMINENGGKMPDAVGIPEEELRHAAQLSVCKINIDSDLRLAMTGTIRCLLQRASRQVRPPRVPEARPGQHQGAGAAQAARTSWAAPARP